MRARQTDIMTMKYVELINAEIILNMRNPFCKI